MKAISIGLAEHISSINNLILDSVYEDGFVAIKMKDKTVKMKVE